MTIITLLILILATWRISLLFVNEDGPFGMFEWLRYWTGVKYNEKREPFGTGLISDILSCVWCLSVWVGVIITIFYLIVPDYTTWLCLPFALSAGAIIVENIANG